MNTPRTDALLVDRVFFEDRKLSIQLLTEHARTLENELAACSAAFDRQQEMLDRNAEQIASKQAQIDRLMMEYCPEEMSPEQKAEWKKHQRPLMTPEQKAEWEKYQQPVEGVVK
jgi:hypothetical protein